MGTADELSRCLGQAHAGSGGAGGAQPEALHGEGLAGSLALVRSVPPQTQTILSLFIINYQREDSKSEKTATKQS